MIVWGNAAFHTSIAIREALKRGGPRQQVHLIAVPPYAPDRNPIERVWNMAKAAIANITHETFTGTRTAFENYINIHTFNCRI